MKKTNEPINPFLHPGWIEPKQKDYIILKHESIEQTIIKAAVDLVRILNNGLANNNEYLTKNGVITIYDEYYEHLKVRSKDATN